LGALVKFCFEENLIVNAGKIHLGKLLPRGGGLKFGEAESLFSTRGVGWGETTLMRGGENT